MWLVTRQMATLDQAVQEMPTLATLRPKRSWRLTSSTCLCTTFEKKCSREMSISIIRRPPLLVVNHKVLTPTRSEVIVKVQRPMLCKSMPLRQTHQAHDTIWASKALSIVWQRSALDSYSMELKETTSVARCLRMKLWLIRRTRCETWTSLGQASMQMHRRRAEVNESISLRQL